MGALLGALLIMEKQLDYLEKSRKTRIHRNSSIELENRFGFVKIIYRENGNFGLALRKRLFCDAKPTLLPCKTAAFGTQNNRFYNTLIARQLHNAYTCEKYLHILSIVPTAFSYSNAVAIALFFQRF